MSSWGNDEYVWCLPKIYIMAQMRNFQNSWRIVVGAMGLSRGSKPVVLSLYR